MDYILIILYTIIYFYFLGFLAYVAEQLSNRPPEINSNQHFYITDTTDDSSTDDSSTDTSNTTEDSLSSTPHLSCDEDDDWGGTIKRRRLNGDYSLPPSPPGTDSETEINNILDTTNYREIFNDVLKDMVEGSKKEQEKREMKEKVKINYNKVMSELKNKTLEDEDGDETNSEEYLINPNLGE